jgi:hypothetical protein
MFDRFVWWNANQPAAPDIPANLIAQLTRLHPQTLLAGLERFYSTRPAVPNVPDYRFPIPPVMPEAPVLGAGIANAVGQTWDHAIYGFMVENTRIFEIFDRVVREYEAGERFETPDPDTALWLRSTEMMFYRDLPSGFIGALTSGLRPDMRAIRRNMYYRLLGLDLNHGLNGKGAYSYEKPQAANRDFVVAFESLLREVWRGAMNAQNQIGPNETDNAAIAEHAQNVREMLRVRRLNGNLRLEEFWAVVTMSWFHLAVRANTPIVVALKAEAESPGARLRKLGERVGIQAHAHADAFFEMAYPLSQILTFIETNPIAVNPAAVAGYYLGGGAWTAVADDMRTIITQWSIATSRDLKAQRVAQIPVSPPPPPGRTIQGRNEIQAGMIAPPR